MKWPETPLSNNYEISESIREAAKFCKNNESQKKKHKIKHFQSVNIMCLFILVELVLNVPNVIIFRTYQHNVSEMSYVLMRKCLKVNGCWTEERVALIWKEKIVKVRKTEIVKYILKMQLFIRWETKQRLWCIFQSKEVFD